METVDVGLGLEEGKSDEELFEIWDDLTKRGEENLRLHGASGEEICLQEAVRCFQDASSISALGIGDPGFTFELLGIVHLLRFDLIGDRADLDEAIIHDQNALELRPLGQPGRATSLLNLGNAFITRFSQLGDCADLNEAIAQYQEALQLTPLGDINRDATLFGVARALLDRFGRIADREDLDEAIVHCQAALEAIPLRHPDRVIMLAMLARALFTRFGQTGDCSELDESIFHYQNALELTPLGHPHRISYLIGLASSLGARFQQFGNRVDLDEAIRYNQSVLELVPIGYPARPAALDNQSQLLRTRFQQGRETIDLDQAIMYGRSSLETGPFAHSNRLSSLISTGRALLDRFLQVGDRADLDEAVVFHQEALEISPLGHSQRCISLSTLAEALKTRFDQFGNSTDLDEAISHYQGALNLMPISHLGRPTTLNNLASALLARFRQIGEHNDLESAIVYYRGSLHRVPPGHPNHSSSLCNLAKALRTRLDQPAIQDAINQSTVDMRDYQVEIIDLLDAATSTTCGPPDDRLDAALFWVDCALGWSDSSALDAYRVSLGVLETVIATAGSMESRHTRITSMRSPLTRSLAVDGAAVALNAGRIDLAVELLEQGRSILLTQAGKYKTRVDDLRLIDPSLSNEFESVSQSMERSVMSAAQGVGGAAVIQSDIITEYGQLLERWTAIVDRIRDLPGFESFLGPTPFETLRAAAAHGPVIIINISKWRSDAIIVSSHREPLLVNLPRAKPEALARMAATAQAETQSKEFDKLLRKIWERLVRPVVQVLGDKLQLQKGSRIWWCPTGLAARLPLHAAGIFTQRDQILLNIYVSSYTSTLLALIHAREGIPNIPSIAPKLLLVGQTNTPGKSPLPSVTLETEHISSIVPLTTTLTGLECTCEAVLSKMRQHDWMHIDIASQDLQNAELAFLAACHSAEGNIDRPDEVLHLTAGLQFAGVRGVVGTLWAMSDEVGPIISRAFYSKLLSDKGPTAGSSAHALHRAVSQLRKQNTGIPKSQWASFVHYGC